MVQLVALGVLAVAVCKVVLLQSHTITRGPQFGNTLPGH